MNTNCSVISNSSVTSTSPVKKYGSMPPLCLDAIAQLLNCHDKGPNSRRLPPLNLCPNLFGEKARFAAHHADLFHVVAEASEHARGEQEVSLLKNVFTTIAVSVGQILEVSDDQTDEVLAFQLRKLQGAPLLL